MIIKILHIAYSLDWLDHQDGNVFPIIDPSHQVMSLTGKLIISDLIEWLQMKTRIAMLCIL